MDPTGGFLIAGLVASLASTGVSIANAEKQKKAAKKNAKRQAEEQRRQARIAQAKATREARVKAARAQAMGSSAGVGGSIIDTPIQSYQSTAEGNIFNIGEATEYNVDAINAQKDNIINKATASQVKAGFNLVDDFIKVGTPEKKSKDDTGPFEWTETESGL